MATTASGGDRAIQGGLAPAIRAVDVVKRYGTVEALRGLTFDVRRGELFGLPRSESPEDIDAFEAYMEAMLASGDLDVSDRARELAVDIVMRPPLPPHLLPLRELVNQVTVGLLPAEVRRLYGFRWDPLRAAALRSGQEYVRRLVVPLLPDRLRLSPSARAAA